MVRDDTLVFMHVPKCAGTSMTNSLIRAVSPRSVLGGFDLSLFGDFHDFCALPDLLRNIIYTKDLPRGEFDFVTGHMAYSTLRRRFPNARLMTVLRQPIERLVSHFLYWRALPEKMLEQQLGPLADWVRLTHGMLFDFLLAKEIACHTDNLLTRFLLWPHPAIPLNDFISPELNDKLYSEAIQNLCDFDFVDLIENPMIEQNVSDWLSCPFELSTDNETSGDVTMPGVLEDTDELTERIVRLTAIDRRLWTHLAEKLALPSACWSHGDWFTWCNQKRVRIPRGAG
jgi:hypothetical protein